MLAIPSANNSGDERGADPAPRFERSQRLFVGLDLHQTHTPMHVLDANGKRVERRTVKGRWTLAVAEVEKLSERS